MIAGGKSCFGSIGWKGSPTGAGFVLSVVCFPCSGTEDDASKVVEAAISVVETEPSVVVVFSGTEEDTPKAVEAAASFVAVSMLTSGVSVVDADESTLWSTTFVEGSPTSFKVGVALSFLRMLGRSLLEIIFFHTYMKRKNVKN